MTYFVSATGRPYRTAVHTNRDCAVLFGLVVREVPGPGGHPACRYCARTPRSPSIPITALPERSPACVS